MLNSFNFIYLIYAAILFAGLSHELSETVVFACFGYVGILTHYIRKWSEKVEKNETFELKKVVPSIILSVITTTVLVCLRAELVNIFVFTRLSSFMVGYVGNSWFFGFIETKLYPSNIPKNEDQINN